MMLKVINLYVLDRIFSEARINLSASQKQLYIDALVMHFKDKPATERNSYAFELQPRDFKNTASGEVAYIMKVLVEAGLVEYNSSTYLFKNMWGKFIDRSQLDKTEPTREGFTPLPIQNYKDQLLERSTLYELTAMKYRLRKEQTRELILLFIQEQIDSEKKYINIQDCSRHCGYWIGKNTDKVTKLGETVKSNGKIFK